MPEPSPAPATETEAFETLVARVGRKSPRIPPAVLARRALDAVPPHEWPARAEALDAILRRLDAVKLDGLKIATRPPDGRTLGDYTTKRRGAETRPYLTRLDAVEPLDAHCACPDFLKNSLGLCKHALVILENLYSKPRLLARALKEQESRPAPSGLRWDPIRPLLDDGDWLARVHWPEPPARATSKRLAAALQWFRPTPEGPLALKKTFPADPARRLALVADLRRAFPGPSLPDPALRALLDAEHDHLARIVHRALTPQERRAAFKGLKQSLYPYQREGVERFLTRGRLLLADDMGLGKTAQAIACCEILQRAGRVRRGLVIAPASLKPQWAREWARFSDLPVTVVDGSPAERLALYASKKSGFLIINYEQLLRDLEPIRAWNPDLVVLDEAQRIKNWSTKTALSVKGLTPPYRLVLTGTPMENRIEELASVVEWVDEYALEPKWRLSPLHSVHADGRGEVTGVRHLDTLRSRLAPVMLRRIRKDVLSQLPPRTDVRVPIELTEPQREEHDALVQPIVSLMQRAKTRPLSQPEFLRLMSLLTTQRIISNGLAQLRFEDEWPSLRRRPPDDGLLQSLATPKLPELRRLIQQIVHEQGRKVVVFSQWRRMLTLAHWAVGDALAASRLRAGFFTGAEGQKRRTQNIVEFHDDPDFRVLFATDAGGVGLNLQHAANCVINLELPWNPAVLEQRIGRIYRLGQSQPIDVFNLVCEQGIESRIASLVGSKQAFFKGLFDGETDSVQFDQAGSFLSRVETLYGESLARGPASPAPADDDSDIDAPADDVSDPYEPLLTAADESQDLAVPAAETSPLPEPEPTPLPTTATSPGGDHVRTLFSQLHVHRSDDGHLHITAPPDAADALSSLLLGLASLLQSPRPPSNPDSTFP